MSLGAIKDYSQDHESHRRWRSGPTVIALGLVVLAALAVFLYYGLVATEAERRATALVVSFAVAMLALACVALLQRRARCARCGAQMVPVHLDIPRGQRSSFWSPSDTDRDKDAFYAHDEERDIRVMRKVFVCHPCKTFFMAFKQAAVDVDGGRDGIKRQQEFRKTKRRMAHDGTFDRAKKRR